MAAEIIHIDGPDKTGKDSIRREIVKLGKGNHLVYVRSFLSQIVYGRLYNRNINEDFFFECWSHAANILDNKFFFIDCSYELVKERFIKHDEDDLDIKDWKKHRSVFYDVIQEAETVGIKINRIDTTTDTISQSANKIQSKL
jgi:thymidylate kinase